jgi:hypothetical protein
MRWKRTTLILFIVQREISLYRKEENGLSKVYRLVVDIFVFEILKYQYIILTHLPCNSEIRK